MRPQERQPVEEKPIACPLCGTRNGSPTFVATGTLLAVNQERFLVTAAHAYDDLHHNPIMVPRKGGWTPIEGDLLVTIDPAPGTLRRRGDHVDLAIFRLSDECAVALGELFQFAPAHSLGCWDRLCLPEGYRFCGYPEKLVQGTDQLEFRPTLLVYETPRASSTLYSALGLTERTHIIAHFNSQKVMFPDGRKRAVGHPEGMSGGPILSVRDSKLAQPHHQTTWLSGIVIEHSRLNCGLIGVRIEAAVGAIAKWRPHLIDALPDIELLNLDCRIDANDPS